MSVNLSKKNKKLNKIIVNHTLVVKKNVQSHNYFHSVKITVSLKLKPNNKLEKKGISS